MYQSRWAYKEGDTEIDPKEGSMNRVSTETTEVSRRNLRPGRDPIPSKDILTLIPPKYRSFPFTKYRVTE